MTLKPVAIFGRFKGDFIDRHHTEARVQLYGPKEETFPIPLKYIDVTGSTRTDLDVLEEWKIDDYWNIDSSKHLSDSWRGFTKFTLLTGKTPKDTCGPGGDWQRFKRQPDQIMYGQKYGRKLVKPLRIEKKTRMGKRKAKTWQCSKAERNLLYRPRWQSVFRNPQKLERPMTPSMPCKRMNKQYPSIVKTNAEPKNGNEREFRTVWLKSVIPRIYEASSRIIAVQNTSRSHCWKRIYFYDTLLLGA